MNYVRKKSVLPIYFVGAVWLLWSLFLPLYRPLHFVLAALVSAIAYFAGKIIFPDRGYAVNPVAQPQGSPQPAQARQGAPAKKAEPAKTYPPKIQELVDERNRAISEFRRLNDSIADPKVSAQIDRMEATTGKIIDAVVEAPAKLPQIKKFMSYYLPTTMKLLNAYDRMDSTGASGVNIDGTKGKIEDMLDTVCQAFDKQLDSLYGAEALDISTDITVMEQLLAQEGLAGADINSVKPPSPSGSGAASASAAAPDDDIRLHF